MSDAGSAQNEVAGLLRIVQTALLPPPAYLQRAILASSAVYGIGCFASIALLLLARRLDDFWLFRVRSKFICPHSSFAFLLANVFACAALCCQTAVVYISLQDPMRRLTLGPYAWFGCIWTAPWTAFWFSFAGGICGLFLLPSTRLAFRGTSSFLQRMAPIVWNVVCIGAPIVALAVSVPLAVVLSSSATAAYRDLLSLRYVLTPLSQGASVIDESALQQVAGLQFALQQDVAEVKTRWAHLFWFWTGWLAWSLAVYIPTFLILIRSMIITSRGVTSSQHGSALSSPDMELLPDGKRASFFGEPLEKPEKRQSLMSHLVGKVAHRPHSEDEFVFTDDTRRKQRRVLFRTALLFTSGLIGAAIYFGLLCWLASIDPINESADNSSIAYCISTLAYALANLVAVGVIAQRLLSQRKQAQQDRRLSMARPSLVIDTATRKAARAQDPTLDSPFTPLQG